MFFQYIKTINISQFHLNCYNNTIAGEQSISARKNKSQKGVLIFKSVDLFSLFFFLTELSSHVQGAVWGVGCG